MNCLLFFLLLQSLLHATETTLVLSTQCTTLEEKEQVRKLTQATASIEQALKDLYAHKPYLKPQHTTAQPPKKEAWPDYNTCLWAIDIAAMTTAFIRIYRCHYEMFTDPIQEDGWWDKTFNYMCPELIQHISKQSTFFKHAIEIALETIILKTVAKMILYCSKGDGFDLIQKALQKTKQFFIG